MCIDDKFHSGLNDDLQLWLACVNSGWSESPCPAELLSADLHSLFFQIYPRRRFFINNFYLKSSHRLKSISGTIMIVNKNSFDFIAILLLAGGLIFIGNLRGLQASLANILKI